MHKNIPVMQTQTKNSKSKTETIFLQTT